MNLPIVYDNITVDESLRLYTLVENLIIVELKAVDTVDSVWQAQILSHLKLTRLHVGFLINFNVAAFKDGIKRYIL